MSKQTQILKVILDCFQIIQSTNNEMKIDFNEIKIRVFLKKSLNKNEIIRRLLNDVVLSNDEIIQLLRIIYKKKE